MAVDDQFDQPIPVTVPVALEAAPSDSISSRREVFNYTASQLDTPSGGP